MSGGENDHCLESRHARFSRRKPQLLERVGFEAFMRKRLLPQQTRSFHCGVSGSWRVELFISNLS